MSQEYIYSLQSAKEYSQKGELQKWVQEYLRGEGRNIKFADYLLEGNPKFVFLKEFPLRKLVRIMGPEPGMIFTEPVEKWERRVKALVEEIEKGVEFPPLIVTDLWTDLQLSDGSHRHEALLRCGVEKYWTAFLFTKEESKKLLD